MKICPINELVNTNFNPVFLNALRQFWHNTKSFHCIGMPKKQNLFLFIEGCTITYTNKQGKTLVAHSGDIVYTPVGSEYTAEMYDFQNSSSHTIGVNFLLSDQWGEPLTLSDDIIIFRSHPKEAVSALFNQLLTYDTSSLRLQIRIPFCEILCILASDMVQEKASGKIAKAIDYLSEHIEENPTVAELASLCNISEVYFRKEFKKCLGTSPARYRNNLRLKRARSYLEYGDISVQEISDTLGYSTVSHFIKEFRIFYGCSPLKYRKQVRNELT